MLILELLKHVAKSSDPGGSGRVCKALNRASEREFLWTIEAGLGPLLLRAISDQIAEIPAPRHEILLSSDLTARLRHRLRVETAGEVIDVCAGFGAPATLLKGISISEQYYPAGHLRTMSDIDILLPAKAHQAVEAELLRRGFQRGSDPLMEDAHHGIPMFHPERQVWIELHWSLYPQRSELMGNRTFGSQNVTSQSVASFFNGRRVSRLSDELQLVYIASSWILDLTLSKIHPSFLPALFDAVHLLQCARRDLDWNGIIGWLDNELAAASLYVMLSYLAQRRVCTAPIISNLRASQSLVSAVELSITHAMLDYYLIGGRRWKLFLPPPVPGRYSLRRQWRKRWSKTLFAPVIC